MITETENVANKRMVWSAMRAITQSSPDNVRERLEAGKPVLE